MLGRQEFQLLLFFIFILSMLHAVSCQRYRQCVNGTSVGPLPSTATNTTQRLRNLRALFAQNGINAYIIPPVDEHQSEYVAPQAKRRQYMSGFSGSAGTAIVTMKKAALWTDGRYFEQGEMQLDCNWILQKSGQPKVPSENTWLSQELGAGHVVGIDPRLIAISSWQSRSKILMRSGIQLKAVQSNLVDEIWTDKPVPPKTKLTVLDVKYTGETWQNKVRRIRENIAERKATVIVLSLLDDIAWMLCLRGQDIPYNPFFFAYVILTKDEIKLYVDKDKLTSAVQSHLCPDNTNKAYCVQIFNYTSVRFDLDKILSNPMHKLWIAPDTSYSLQLGINDTQIMLDYSPVQLMKAQKNSIEINGMKTANTKDGVAIVEFFAWLEKEIKAGVKNIDEVAAAAKLKELKGKQKDFKDLSFETISAFGRNGAVIHYRPSSETSLNITDKGLYLVDSGCQFPEGTTDITRTVHFGTPTAFEKDAYTRVLQGSIRLAMIVFPPGIYGRHIDALARSSLWASGLNYNHGTGHGIGHYLSVHEGPQAIGSGKFYPSEKPLYAGMVQSDEPGYYETGKFGIRLETALLTINATTKHQFEGKQFLGFEPITFVPFQKELIDASMLNEAEIKWLNDFNANSRKILGAELKRQGKTDGYNWLIKNSETVVKPNPSPPSPRLSTNPSSGNTITLSHGTLALVTLAYVFWFLKQIDSV
ncbi:xaa-Pro aminopeptidase 1-like [Rhopilema esculentum]|uniref:xaa-Pro aminopeptidase 1-like n=1 Tax=Rhopilema esculentum TaxID=499914 RepID=UPI0031DFDC39